MVEEARVREEERLVADGEVDFDWRDDELVQEQHFLLRQASSLFGFYDPFLL